MAEPNVPPAELLSLAYGLLLFFTGAGLVVYAGTSNDGPERRISSCPRRRATPLLARDPLAASALVTPPRRSTRRSPGVQMVKTAMAAQTHNAGAPETVLREINRRIHDQLDSYLVTAVYAVVDTASGDVTVAVARTGSPAGAGRPASAG